MADSSQTQPASQQGMRVLELNLAHSSWYWVHREGEPEKMRFWLHKGRLLLGEEKNCVGVNLADVSAAQWLAQAPEEQRTSIRTAKLATPEELDWLELLPGLEALECSGLDDEQLTWICSLGMPLRFLYLSWCDDLSELHPLGAFRDTLVRLAISDCPTLKELAGLSSLTKIARMDIINCDNVWELDPISPLKEIRRLVVRNCENVHTLGPVAVLPQIVSLDLSRCKKIKDLTPLGEIETLVSLDLSDCDGVTSIAPLEKLANLKELHLFGCDRFRDLRPLHRLPNLVKLSMPCSIQEGDLLGISISQTSIRQLDLRNCRNIVDIEPLSRMTDLLDLSLAGCRSITDISPLAALKKLVRLDLACCTEITDLSPLRGLRRLHDLYVGGCTNLDRKEILMFRKTHPKCEVHTV